VTEVRTVAVVGLGLIGGSLARDLSARGISVLGYDRDPEAIRGALEEGVIASALGAGLEGLEEAEALILALPVERAAALLETALPRLGRARFVTDVGSTKRAIGDAAERLGLGERFVGSHPLCGDHRSGWSASRTALFQGARVYLCPTPASGEGALASVRALWSALGAHPEEIDPATHDQVLAWTSHLPQAASTALALALRGAGIAPGELGPGGRGMTRLAASSPALWTGIATENAGALVRAIAALEAELRALRTALSDGDEGAVGRLFTAARAWTGEG
jgi:prephenate dehydrogenase